MDFPDRPDARPPQDDPDAPAARPRRRRTARPDRTVVVSHEIRGPLGVVTALAEVLLTRDLAAEDRRLVELIRLAGAHAFAVAEDLVAEASLGARRFRVLAEPLSPADLVRSVADLWSPLVTGERRRLVVSVSPDCPDAIVSDVGRLRQILFNLVSNASKAADSGTITVAVRRGGRRRVVFEVTDEGRGLPKGFSTEPFADPAERPLPGAGLGLWISARIAAALSGTLVIADRPEGGVAATLTLPIAAPLRRSPRDRPGPVRAAAASAPPPVAPEVPDMESSAMDSLDDDLPPVGFGSPLAGLAALVVDDSAVSRMLLEAVLTSFDMTVLLAANGDEAERLALQTPPDVILLDWSLARETGADVLDRLADLLGPAVPPAVLVTASARALMGSGIAAHVVKPFTPRELHDALEMALADARVHASAG